MKLLMMTALPALLCLWCGGGRSTAAGDSMDFDRADRAGARIVCP